MFKRKNKKIEKYRKLINDILIKKNIKYTDKEMDFYLFLYNDDFNMFNIWFNICSAKENFNLYLEELERLIDVFNKTDNIISFKKLFQMDKEWYEFYNTSATLDGRILPNEKRLGVDKLYATDITKIKQMTCDSNMDNAIELYTHFKFLIFNQIMIDKEKEFNIKKED